MQLMSDASWTILAIFAVLAAAGSVAALILFLPENKKDSYSGFTRTLYDWLNFNTFLLSPIMKALYIAVTLIILMLGILLMFNEYVVAGLLVFLLGPLVIRISYEIMLLFVSMREQLVNINNKMDRIASAADPDGKYIPVKEEPAPRAPKVKKQNEPVYYPPQYQQQPQYQQPQYQQPPYQQPPYQQPPYQQPPYQQPPYQQPPYQQPPYQQPPVEQTHAPAPRTCPTCGRPVGPDAVFCTGCGSRL